MDVGCVLIGMAYVLSMCETLGFEGGREERKENLTTAKLNRQKNNKRQGVRERGEERGA